MSVRYKDVQILLEDPTNSNNPLENNGTKQGIIMNKRIPQPSSGIICLLTALGTGLLFVIIILIVTITRQGVDQTDHNMEVKLKNLSMGVHSRVEKLSQDDSRMMEKLADMESFIKDMKASEVISKINGMEKSVKRILSDDVIGSLASDLQRVLGAVAMLRDEIRKDNTTNDPLCLVGWRHFSTSCYYFSQRPLNWEDAKKDCETKKAHLVVINSNDENHFLHDLSHYWTTWIGLTDVDGSWKWVDGTSYDITPKLWHPGQPDDWFAHGHGGGEDCAQLKIPIGWNDDHCSMRYPYICEKKIP